MTGSRAALASFLVLLVLGLTAVLSHHDAVSSTASADRPPAEVVTMDNQLNFAPDTVRVQVGETVEWRNTSLLVHTVTADPDTAARAEHVQLPDGAEPFHSGNMDPETSWSHTFEVSGTYRYFCVPHEAAGMLGTIIVEPE